MTRLHCCDECLRRGALIGMLAAPLAGLLHPGARKAARRGPGARTAALLSLSDEALIEAVGGSAKEQTESAYRRFDARAARAAIEGTGCEAICRHRDRYPERLTHLDDPPNPIYLRGGVERLARLTAEPGVAVVGGRQPSQYAREVAADMGRDLEGAGVTVISGLALGVDAASHRGALLSGDSVIAVLGSGPDYVYPRRHAQLYAQIVARGVVLSELPPGTRPYQWSFPARNRIMAALAHVVVVVEARESSGSLITADLAGDIGREVVAVPGQVTARVAAGSNRLLREGAGVVRHAEDVLDTLFAVGARPVRQRALPTLEPELRTVLDAVEARDSLQLASRRAGLSAGGLRAALGRLETLGLVRSDGLGGYERCLTNGSVTSGRAT